MLRLCQGQYTDFNVRPFHEKLREEPAIRLRYTWVKLALQGAGLVDRGWNRRKRRLLAGMMLHPDGSRHLWFQDDRSSDLVEGLDDATSKTYYTKLVEYESTQAVKVALGEVIEQKGRFCTLSSNRVSHFFETPKAGGRSIRGGYRRRGGAEGVGIQMIPAYSPQARGRSERRFRTWQGRLSQ